MKIHHPRPFLLLPSLLFLSLSSLPLSIQSFHSPSLFSPPFFPPLSPPLSLLPLSLPLSLPQSSTNLLHSARIIDQVPHTRRLIALAIARQYFGCYIQPQLWLVSQQVGLTLLLPSSFLPSSFLPLSSLPPSFLLSSLLPSSLPFLPPLFGALEPITFYSPYYHTCLLCALCTGHDVQLLLVSGMTGGFLVE